MIKSVVIVGGGTAGWITACYLNAKLNHFHNGRRIDISVIEPEIPNRIGVGEATIPTLLNTLQVLGISEKEFMKCVGASFKQGIKFVNWHRIGEHYYHAFDRRPSGPSDDAAVIWAASNRKKSFADTVSSQPTFCEAGLSPKAIGQAEFTAPMAYAYHLDAEKFADLLSRNGRERGIKRIFASIVDAQLDEQGNITSVITSENIQHQADLFIDCSGFQAELIGKRMEVEWVDYSQWLLCDSAVTFQVPYSLKTPPHRPPFTTSTALSSGWAWDIPLRDRRGLGYVYASQFIPDDVALAELIKLEGHHAKDLPIKQLRFQSGHRKISWKNNCIAIGLSSGFLEPLESTGIFMVEFAAALLCEFFPHTSHQQPLANQFNALVNARYDEILNFIALHYCLSKRTDSTFWTEVQCRDRIPSGLLDMLELWQSKICSFTDFHDATQVFGHLNYEYILYGMDFHYPFLKAPQMPPSARERYVQKETEIGLRKLPQHDQWLKYELGDDYAIEVGQE